MTEHPGIIIPKRVDESAEIDYGKAGADFAALARDRIPIRAMQESDLNALIAIDRRITGRQRSAYFVRKLEEALYESGVRVSLVAEQDGTPVGFVMARVDFGEFGRMEAIAVMDTIGIEPDYRNRGIGRALLSQLLVNLATLRIERIRTEVDWHDRELLAFLDRCGFLPSQQLCFEYGVNG
jgi:ribosomal protein S18 acetylase RimI-like enzyme